MARAFVIRSFNAKTDSAGNRIDFEKVHQELIAPALKACDIAGSTTGEIVEPGNIREDMFALIVEADVVICDVTQRERLLRTWYPSCASEETNGPHQGQTDG